MANFNGINIDANVEESTGEFIVLPAGKYKACIVSDEIKDNRAGNGKIWAIKLQIIQGQYSGQTLTDYINIVNVNLKAQAIGQGILKRICNICNVQFPPTDTVGFMGKPMEVQVKVEEFTSNTVDDNGNPKKLKSNKVSGYSKVSTAEPAQKQETTQSAW